LPQPSDGGPPWQLLVSQAPRELSS
jgi:hypothetical protein